MNNRLRIIFLLGFSSGLPLVLITSTLQAWFAESGMSVMFTAMLSLIGLPYAYRMVWGPLLDHYPLSVLGKRRSWILLMQLLLLSGFNLMAWLSPVQTPQLMVLIAFLMANFSAAQDTAIDAQRAEYLPVAEHALGASLAVFGYRLALLIAGGFALIIASKYGWAFTYRLMGMLMLVGIAATLCSKEPEVLVIEKKGSILNAFTAPVKEFFGRQGSVYLLIFILFYKLGEAFTSTTSGIIMPFLIQGIGFSLDSIGYINKMMGISSVLLGGLAAGILLLRWSLYKALFTFGLLQAVTTLLFVALAMVGKNMALFAVAVVCDNFAAGMGSTALVALFMRLVNRQFTATQFSLLVAVASMPRIFSGPIAALLQQWLGWSGLFQISFVLALGFIPFLILIKDRIKSGEEEMLSTHVVAQR